MRAALTALLAALALSIGAGGCGASSSHKPKVNPTAPQASLTASSSTATSARHPAPAHRRGKRTTTSSSVASTSSAGAVSTAPPATPAGTPAAPAGLRQSTGYGTYELCSGTCSGAVPPSLRRPLHLPAGCAGAGGADPVAPAGTANLTLTRFIGSAWSGARVQWAASPGYRGPVLIRGRRLDGAGAVGFGEGHTPYDELQLLASGQGAPPARPGGRAWLTFTRVAAPGCYAYQVDGIGFSSVIPFRAR